MELIGQAAPAVVVSIWFRIRRRLWLDAAAAREAQR